VGGEGGGCVVPEVPEGDEGHQLGVCADCGSACNRSVKWTSRQVGMSLVSAYSD
jgi:hypothetical protein